MRKKGVLVVLLFCFVLLFCGNVYAMERSLPNMEEFLCEVRRDQGQENLLRQDGQDAVVQGDMGEEESGSEYTSSSISSSQESSRSQSSSSCNQASDVSIVANVSRRPVVVPVLKMVPKSWLHRQSFQMSCSSRCSSVESGKSSASAEYSSRSGCRSRSESSGASRYSNSSVRGNASPIMVFRSVTTSPLVMSPVIFENAAKKMMSARLKRCKTSFGDLTCNPVEKTPRGLFDACKEQKLFFHACKKGDIKTVENMIEQARIFYPNALDEEGDTPLHIAVLHGRLDVVKFLMQSEKICVDIHEVNDDELTPVFIAYEEGYIDIVKYLIKYGATITSADRKRLADCCNETLKWCVRQVNYFKSLELDRKVYKIKKLNSLGYLDLYLCITILQIVKKVFSGNMRDCDFNAVQVLYEAIQEKIQKKYIKRAFGDIDKRIEKAGVLALLNWVLSFKGIAVSDCLRAYAEKDFCLAKITYSMLLRFSLAGFTMYNDLLARRHYLFECGFYGQDVIEFALASRQTKMRVPKLLLVNEVRKKEGEEESRPQEALISKITQVVQVDSVGHIDNHIDAENQVIVQFVPVEQESSISQAEGDMVQESQDGLAPQLQQPEQGEPVHHAVVKTGSRRKKWKLCNIL